MKKLTANLVQQRLKSCTADLDKVTQINVTGGELEDVSLLRTMTGIEILSLSVNKISRLYDFQFCKNLLELYLRHNKIADLFEISYLKNLPKLRLLLLSDNPCCKEPSYRMTVIRNLKYLRELDGVPITTEERKKAQKLGLEFNTHTNENFTSENPKESANKIIKTSEPTKESMRTDEVGFEPRNRGKKEETIQHSDLTSDNNESFKNSPRNAWKHQEPKITLHSTRNNILSAILSLIKELDYSGLQLLDAEICSRLNAI